MESMHLLQVAAEGQAARRILADAMVAPAPAPAITSASGMAAVVDTAHQTGIASADGMASVAATVTKAMAGSVKGPIILMHGAIQGGEVWEFPRLPEAPGVSAPPLPQHVQSTLAAPVTVFCTEAESLGGLGVHPPARDPRRERPLHACSLPQHVQDALATAVAAPCSKPEGLQG